MPNEGLNIKLNEIKFDANGNLVITNKEVIASVKKIMEETQHKGDVIGHNSCQINVEC